MAERFFVIVDAKGVRVEPNDGGITAEELCATSPAIARHLGLAPAAYEERKREDVQREERREKWEPDERVAERVTQRGRCHKPLESGHTQGVLSPAEEASGEWFWAHNRVSDASWAPDWYAQESWWENVRTGERRY